MFLCLGSTPILPNISITPLVFMLSAFAEAIIQESAKELLKEWVPMFSAFPVILLGTLGSFGISRVV